MSSANSQITAPLWSSLRRPDPASSPPTPAAPLVPAGAPRSAPALVAGTLALIHYLHGGDAAAFQHAVQDLSQGSVMMPELAGDIGNGRFDVAETVQASE